MTKLCITADQLKKPKLYDQWVLYSVVRNALHITDYLYIKRSLISRYSGQHVLSFRVFLNENWDAYTSRPVKWFCCYNRRSISPNKGKGLTIALIYNTPSSLERAQRMQQTVQRTCMQDNPRSFCEVKRRRRKKIYSFCLIVTKHSVSTLAPWPSFFSFQSCFSSGAPLLVSIHLNSHSMSHSLWTGNSTPLPSVQCFSSACPYLCRI